MRRIILLAPILLVLICGTAFGQTPLENCAEQFIGGLVSNAPTLIGTPSNTPSGNNEHLCYRDDGVTFFATEYAPDVFTPRWAAYKLSPGNYGTNGCSTFSRNKHKCYAKKQTFAGFEACTSAPSDPFHEDLMVQGAKFEHGVFTQTNHDNGHIAPRQAFGWHVCGNYQTFSMANMSAQRAFLNQQIWMELEKQVLTWAVDEGPIFVTTGTIFGRFPHERFDVYDGTALDPNQIYNTSADLEPTVTQNMQNFDDHPSSQDLLHPKRRGDTAAMEPDAKDTRLPTGYFKIIFRPAMNGDPAEAIAFMLRIPLRI